MWIYIFGIIFLIIILSVAVIYHDTHNFVVRSYEVPSDKVERDYTFVLLSDLHGYVYGDNNDRLLKAIDDAGPDAILCAGDMFTGHLIKGEIQYQAGLHVLTELAGRYPVYMGLGNHEHKVKSFAKEFVGVYDRYRTLLTEAGVKVLDNDSIDMPELNIRITGLDLSHHFFRKVIKREMYKGYVKTLVGDSDSSRFQVLIAHNPQYFERYAQWGADLTVSGHVHGGIIRLPLLGGVISPAIALFPKYDGGLFRIGDKTMVLSRGLGTHSIHVRMFNPGEVDVIHVRKA